MNLPVLTIVVLCYNEKQVHLIGFKGQMYILLQKLSRKNITIFREKKT